MVVTSIHGGWSMSTTIHGMWLAQKLNGSAAEYEVILSKSHRGGGGGGGGLGGKGSG